MNRDPLKNGTVLRFPDGQEHEVLRLLGAGGNALLYETKILGSELCAAVKEVFPAQGYMREKGQICALRHLPRREKELQRRKHDLTERESRLSQKAGRRNYQVLFLRPPVWDRAELRLPDGTVYSNVENTYVCMDSLAEKGVPLARLTQDGPHSLDEALQIMETVLDAYAALHEDGFLHGDCQSSNLFLLKAGQGGEGFGTACLIDFGSARELGEDGLTAPITDEVLSTDGYCAPELMFPRGDELRLSAAADVWSLGFLLLNLLTDRGLDGIDGVTEFLMLHPEEKILTPDEAADLGCSPAQEYLLKVILNRALANDPNLRYSNAGEMREHVRKLIRCREADTSMGLNPYLLWDAAWRYWQANPSLFQTGHQSRLAGGRIPRRLVVKGRCPDQPAPPLSAVLLLHDLAQKGENAYLYGAGGAGKSVASAILTNTWLESGARIPLYLDLASYTAEMLEECDGDKTRVISALLARQYFGRADVGEELDAMLSLGKPCTPVLDMECIGNAVLMLGTPYVLVLDNLHKVEKSALPAALSALNGMKDHWPGVWVLVQGRAEAPGEENPENRPTTKEYLPARGEKRKSPAAWWKQKLEQLTADEFDAFDCIEDDEYFVRASWGKTWNRALKLQRVELLPLTAEEMLAQVKAVRGERLDFTAGTTLLKQEKTLRLPMFLMRYLELLAIGGDEEKLPNGAMELLYGYFTVQEYRGGGQELHDLLREQLPWVAQQYGWFNRAVCSSEQITAWLRERFGRDVDVDNFFRRAVDELAVLERGGWDEYRFVHDCYQEYFAALFAANCIRQAIARKSAEPLNVKDCPWTAEEARRRLDLCCLTVRDGRVIRTRSEFEVLAELLDILEKLRRRELIHAGNMIFNISQNAITLVNEGSIEQDRELFRRLRKVQWRSSTGQERLIMLPVMLLTQVALKINPAVTQLRSLALVTEDGMAEYQLACLYKHGKGVRASLKKANRYLNRAVWKGYPPALNAKGENEEKAGRYDQAMDLYQKAADKLYPPAMRHLGNLYLNGHGAARNTFKAFNLFEQAAQSGDMPAQYICAKMLEHGIGCMADPQQALFWYDKAAGRGLELAKEAAERLRTPREN